MAVSIAAEVTRIWPTTEATLNADSTVDYLPAKDRAVARAKLDLYGSRTIPSEADIPDLAAYWIADQAAVHLIPLAIDYYMSKQRISDSKENTTVTYYNKVRALQGLRTELETSLVANRQTALETIDTTVRGDDVPAVSTQGMAVDPILRAMWRGPVM